MSPVSCFSEILRNHSPPSQARVSTPLLCSILSTEGHGHGRKKVGRALSSVGSRSCCFCRAEEHSWAGQSFLPTVPVSWWPRRAAHPCSFWCCTRSRSSTRSVLHDPSCLNAWQLSPKGLGGTMLLAMAALLSFKSVTGGFVQAAGKLQPQRLLCQGGAFHTCFAGTGSQPGFVNEPPVIRNRSTSSSPATQARPWCGLLLPARDRAARYCECCF